MLEILFELGIASYVGSYFIPEESEDEEEWYDE